MPKQNKGKAILGPTTQSTTKQNKQDPNENFNDILSLSLSVSGLFIFAFHNQEIEFIDKIIIPFLFFELVLFYAFQEIAIKSSNKILGTCIVFGISILKFILSILLQKIDLNPPDLHSIRVDAIVSIANSLLFLAILVKDLVKISKSKTLLIFSRSIIFGGMIFVFFLNTIGYFEFSVNFNLMVFLFVVLLDCCHCKSNCLLRSVTVNVNVIFLVAIWRVYWVHNKLSLNNT